MVNLPALTLAADDASARSSLNQWLGSQDAVARLRWALEHLPGEHALSTSFGAQSAVALHMASTLRPDIPVILIDTGYLFPETYRFADELTARLSLNLKVYQHMATIFPFGSSSATSPLLIVTHSMRIRS